MTETRRLGRGLEALLGPITREQAERSGALQELLVSAIEPNRYQPRRHFDETALTDLAASMSSAGLLQPVLVRPRKGANGYELIAGERRWLAAQRLRWTKIPAVVKDVDDQTLLTFALIENLQRDDLTPIDEALSYQRLMQEFNASHGDIATLVGRDRSTVANALRLLKLPGEVQEMVNDGRLSEGHGRALLALDERDLTRLAREAATSGWSVRQIEARVRRLRPADPLEPRKASSARHLSPAHRRVEEAMRRKLGTDVRLTPRRRGRGSLTINYYSNDDLSRVLELILGAPFEG